MDYPDFRDYTAQTKTIPTLMKKVKGNGEGKRPRPPSSCGLGTWCPAVEDHGKIGLRSANAGLGMIEYFERRALGRDVEASRLFL